MQTKIEETFPCWVFGERFCSSVHLFGYVSLVGLSVVESAPEGNKSVLRPHGGGGLPFKTYYLCQVSSEKKIQRQTPFMSPEARLDRVTNR